MPRPAKPARLWLKPAEADRAAVWIIKDGGRRISTGFGAEARSGAERSLVDYLEGKHRPEDIPKRPAAQTRISDVLALYSDEVVPKSPQPKKAGARITRLLTWWAERKLTDISTATCQAYVAAHTKGGARRDLEDLRAAVNAHARAERHTGYVEVWLPPKGRRRLKYLTRDEVARLLWVCWRHRRRERPPRGKHQGELVESRSFHDLRHLARFILMGIYTGSRSAPIFKASIKAASDRAFIDLESGIYYRLPEDMVEADNKQSPICRLPPRLLAHLRRWERQKIIGQFVVEWRGEPIKSIKTAWATAIELAGIEGKAVPHTLRHTCVTWLKQAGFSSFDVGEFVGMTEQTVDHVYAHHDPNRHGHIGRALSRAGNIKSRDR